MKMTHTLYAVTAMLAISLSACSSHQQTAKNTSDDSASARSRLVAENENRQLEQALAASKKADAERQRQQMDQAAARAARQD